MKPNPDRSSAGQANVLAYVLLVFTALCWGGNVVLAQLAVGQVSPMVLGSLRWLGVVIGLLAFAHQDLRQGWPILRQHLPFLAVMGALGLTGFNSFFYVAAHFTTAVNVAILQGSIPILVLIGVASFYRTRVLGVQVAGAALTLCGVVVIASGGDFARLTALAFNLGDLMMIAACVFYAGYTVGLRRRPPAPPLALFTVMAGAAFTASLPLALGELALGLFQWPTAKGWVVVLLAMLFPSLLAQLSFMRGVDLIGPGRAGIFVNLVPVFASVLAVTILDEPFHGFHAAALALVLGGIWLSERARARS